MSEFFRAMANAGFALKFDDSKNAPFDLQRLHLSTDTREALEWLRDFELYHLSGWTPVQAEGRLDGHHFYFFARGSYWRFEVGGNERQTRSPRWWHEEPWPSVTGFEAGYMSDEEAVGCILKAIDLFRNGDNSHFKAEHPEYERTVLQGWSAGALSLRTVTILLGISSKEAVTRMRTWGSNYRTPLTGRFSMWSRYPCGGSGRVLAAKQKKPKHLASDAGDATNVHVEKVLR